MALLETMLHNCDLLDRIVRMHLSLFCFPSIVQILISCLISSAPTQGWTPIVVRNVTILGPQFTSDVTNVSRDGGYSALINGNIVWLYDDTECMDTQGNQLSFISNTAGYMNQPSSNSATTTDFGVVNLGTNPDGSPKTAILAHTTVGTGGWIPFQTDELQYNEQMKGKQRVAIWPGTSPTSLSTTEAFLYAPLVYVDSKPQDPSKEYQARGMTLITITAPNSGPVATRHGDLIIPGTEVAYGGFSTILGYKSTDAATEGRSRNRDVYLLGMTASGLQLARVDMNHLIDFSKYEFWDPQGQKFSTKAPDPGLQDASRVYLPGTFSSGSVFFSPYFKTFIMVYFNKMVDSIFYIRYLQLNVPLGHDETWIVGGKNGKGLEAEDAEAVIKYTWSAEQKLYPSPPGPGGFNYAGMAHPEYFNTQYFPKSLYSSTSRTQKRVNAWYGPGSPGVDGKTILLSWTSQEVGGTDNGMYRIQLAMLEFDDIPPDPDHDSPATAGTATSSGTPAEASTNSITHPNDPVSSILSILEHGTAASSFDWRPLRGYAVYILALHVLLYARVHRRVI